MPDDLRGQVADAIVNAAEMVASDRHFAGPSGYSGPLSWEAGADAVLALPAIAAGQAALALLTGDRRDEAIDALADVIAGGYALEDRPVIAHALNALADLLPTGAPNA